MKLTVWIATQEGDSQCYNIVARTKKEALEQMRHRGFFDFAAPRKVVIEYKDAFELFTMVTGEGGGRHVSYN